MSRPPGAASVFREKASTMGIARALGGGLLAVAAMLALPACQVTVVPGGNSNANGAGRTPLNALDAEVRIAHTPGAADVVVSAVLTDSRNRFATLGADQSIEVNGLPLEAAGSGEYRRTIPIANSYEFTGREPTRGVERTTVAGPAEFGVVSPAQAGPASLSGFNLTWSGVNAALEVRVVLRQFVFDAFREAVVTQGSDEGARFLSAQDLAAFVQGANLDITLTKFARTNGIAGLRSATVLAERSVLRTVVPAP
jgi:hypothetical protein